MFGPQMTFELLHPPRRTLSLFCPKNTLPSVSHNNLAERHAVHRVTSQVESDTRIFDPTHNHIFMRGLNGY